MKQGERKNLTVGQPQWPNIYANGIPPRRGVVEGIGRQKNLKK